MAGGENSSTAVFSLDALILAVVGMCLVLIITLIIEKLGGALGGVIAGIPTVTLCSSVLLWIDRDSTAKYAAEMLLLPCVALGTVCALWTWKAAVERTEAHARGDHCATMFAATVSGLGLFGCWCAFGFAMTGLYYLVGGGADFADDDDMDDQIQSSTGTNIGPRLLAWFSIGLSATISAVNAMYDTTPDWREPTSEATETPTTAIPRTPSRRGVHATRVPPSDMSRSASNRNLAPWDEHVYTRAGVVMRYVMRGALALPTVFLVNALQSFGLPFVSTAFSCCPIVSIFAISCLWADFGSVAAISPITSSMMGNLCVAVYGIMMDSLIGGSGYGYQKLGFPGCVAVAFGTALTVTSAPIASVILPCLSELRRKRQAEELKGEREELLREGRAERATNANAGRVERAR